MTTKTKLWNALVALKLADPDRTLSLSNIALAVVIAKIAYAADLDWPTIGTLLLALLNYNAKKTLGLKRAKAEGKPQEAVMEALTAVNETLKTTRADLDSLKARVNLRG